MFGGVEQGSHISFAAPRHVDDKDTCKTTAGTGACSSSDRTNWLFSSITGRIRLRQATLNGKCYESNGHEKEGAQFSHSDCD